MTLTQEISRRIATYREKAGQAPAHVFLGDLKLAQLRQEMADPMKRGHDIKLVEGVILFEGIPVSRTVNAPNHCQVG